MRSCVRSSLLNTDPDIGDGKSPPVAHNSGQLSILSDGAELPHRRFPSLDRDTASPVLPPVFLALCYYWPLLLPPLLTIFSPATVLPPRRLSLFSKLRGGLATPPHCQQPPPPRPARCFACCTSLQRYRSSVGVASVASGAGSLTPPPPRQLDCCLPTK